MFGLPLQTVVGALVVVVAGLVAVVWVMFGSLRALEEEAELRRARERSAAGEKAVRDILHGDP